jgi:hypothetical protein
VFEWRAGLAWALGFGVPKAFLVIALGSEHAASKASSPLYDGIGGLLVMAAFEPFGAAFAFLYLESRAVGSAFDAREARAVARQSFVPLFLLCLIVEGSTLAVAQLFRPLAALPWLIPVALVCALVATTAMRAVLITIAPRIVLDGRAVGPTVSKALEDTRAAYRTILAALLMLVALNLAFGGLLSTPNVFAEVEGAPFSSIWWRVLYLWLGQWLAAPYYAFMFLVRARLEEAGAP